MDYEEKESRCLHTDPHIYGTKIMCIVYGRNVGSCEDCGISPVRRPKFLGEHGIDPDTEET